MAAKVVGAKVAAKINDKVAYAPFLPSRAAGKIFWRIFEELGVKVEQGDEKAEMGSTDLGNLSWNVPALHPTIKISDHLPHSPEFAKAAGSKYGMEMMNKAGLAMAALGYLVMIDPELRQEMRAELERSKLQI